MKKIILAVVVAIVAALGAAPYWFGMQAEKTYTALLQNLKDAHGATVVETRYQRGWLGASADTVIQFRQLPVPLSFSHRIGHGPFPVDDLMRGEFTLRPIQASFQTTVFPRFEVEARGGVKIALLEATTRVGLSGESESRVNLPAYKSPPDQPARFEWQGMSGNLRFSPDLKRVAGTLSAPGLTLSGGGNDVALKTLEASFNLNESRYGISVGDMSASIATFEVQGGEDAAPWTATGLVVSNMTRETGDNIQSTLRAELKKMGTGGGTYGPLLFELQLRNLDAAALKQWRDQMEKTPTTPAEGEAPTAAGPGAFLQLVTALAKKSPEAEITKLNLKTPDGELQGQAKLVLDGRSKDIGDNPMAWLAALEGEAGLSIPASLVKALVVVEIRTELAALQAQGKMQALTDDQVGEVVAKALPERLPQWAEAKRLVADGDNYKLKAALKQGEITLNGQPFTWPGLTPSAAP